MLEPDGFENAYDSDEKARLLILSSPRPVNPSPQHKGGTDRTLNASANASSRKIKRTINRKQQTTENIITHNGKDYGINNGNDKCALYVPILHRIIDQFEVAQQKWGRVFVLRVELHLPHETQNNKCITAFNKRLFQRLKREYGFIDIGF